ncbi:MAG: glycosyltransferase family 9 protein [bacterium]
MRIAIIRFSSLGDILCTGPAVRGLRNAFPEAELTYITTRVYSDIAAALPGVDRVAVIERRGPKFAQDVIRIAWEGPWDLVVDLQGSARSYKLLRRLKPVRSAIDTPPRFRRTLRIVTKLPMGKFSPVPLRMLRQMTPMRVMDDGSSLALNVPVEMKTEVCQRWGNELKGSVALIPGAKHATKCWPGSYWAELVRSFPPRLHLIVLGMKGETPSELAKALDERGSYLDLTGETTLLEMAAILTLSKAVISGDTGPMHMAVAVSTPLVAIYGPTVEEFGFFPFRAKATVLQRNLWCRPCSAHGTERCPLGHHRCMREIQPDDVLRALKGLDLKGLNS